MNQFLREYTEGSSKNARGDYYFKIDGRSYRAICIKSACLEIDDDECLFDSPFRCPWALNDFSDQSFILDINICRIFHYPRFIVSSTAMQ